MRDDLALLAATLCAAGCGRIHFARAPVGIDGGLRSDATADAGERDARDDTPTSDTGPRDARDDADDDATTEDGTTDAASDADPDAAPDADNDADATPDADGDTDADAPPDADATICADDVTAWTSPTITVDPSGFTSPNLALGSDDRWATSTHGPGCHCPFIALSWDGGMTRTDQEIAGPFDTTDVTLLVGGPIFTWGRTWTSAELAPDQFNVVLINPGISEQQGYGGFSFSVPSGARVVGIEVELEGHGNASSTTFFYDHVRARVHYRPSGC